jgi:hypothetical protein
MNMTSKKTKVTTKKANPKKAATAKSTAETQEKKLSGLDAAAGVLKEKGVAMTCQDMISEMAAKGYWSSPKGKTPAATLSSAILREISTKGEASRFAKTAPGRFAARDAVGTTTDHSARATKKSRKRSTKPTDPKPSESKIADGTPSPESVAELIPV